MKRTISGALALAAVALGAGAPAAKPVSLTFANSLLDWRVSWPAEVSAIPALAAHIRSTALRNRATLLTTAAADRAQRKQSGYPFRAYDSELALSVEGITPRLLSLARSVEEDTGGAHPNHGTSGLLWDRTLGREVAPGALFAGGEAALGRVTRNAYCSALTKQRQAKRGSDMSSDPGDPFNQCPALKELAIIPQARKGASAFTTVLFHADPYVAGPYVEGDYDVVLPVTASVLAALKPAYRSSFAVGR